MLPKRKERERGDQRDSYGRRGISKDTRGIDCQTITTSKAIHQLTCNKEPEEEKGDDARNVQHYTTKHHFNSGAMNAN